MANDSTHPSEAGGSREQLVRELAELRRQLADEKHFSQRMLLEATRKSDQMYRALAANLPGGAVFILDRHLRYQLAEGQALQTAGFASAAFEGRTIWEALDASTAAAYEPRFRRVLEGGTFKYEHNSHGRHFVSHGVPIHDAQGAVTHVLAVSYDITDRKLAEETLRESEERFRAVFESSSDCILVWDRQYNYMYANQAAIDHVGTTRDRVIGRNIRDGLGHIPDFMRLWMERVDRAFATGEPFRVEDAVPVGDRLVHSESQISPIRDAAGRVFAVGVVYRDTTDRKQVEEALRQSREDLDRAQAVGQIGWWRLDTRRNVLTWSSENHRIFGVPEGTPMSYESFLSTVHPDDRKFVDTQWAACLRGEPYDIEHRIVVEAQVKWVREKAFLEFGADGRLLGGFGITQDITARKQAEEAARRLNETLEQRVAERTSELAHTVETLQGEIAQRVRAECELTLANEQLAERADQLRRLAGQLTMTERAERKRLSKVLHDGLQQYLVSAKMQIGGLVECVGQSSLKRELAEIENLISDTVRMSRSLNAELSPPILHDGGLPERLEWLARWMREKHRYHVDLFIEDVPGLHEDARVLIFESVREMLFNALKHSKASSARVSLEQAEGGGLRLVVSDEGVGFDPSRLYTSGSDAGFGLFSIRERICLIGGSFEMESSPGKGSRFTLSVPCRQSGVQPAPGD